MGLKSWSASTWSQNILGWSSLTGESTLCLLAIPFSDSKPYFFIHSISIKLPTIVIRPGVPSRATSAFVSGILREPLQGQEAICPIGNGLDDPLLASTKVWVSRWVSSLIDPCFIRCSSTALTCRPSFSASSPSTVLKNFAHARNVPSDALPSYWRTVNLPGFSVSVAQEIEALRKFAGEKWVSNVDKLSSSRHRSLTLLHFPLAQKHQSRQSNQIWERWSQSSHRLLLASSIRQLLRLVLRFPRRWWERWDGEVYSRVQGWFGGEKVKGIQDRIEVSPKYKLIELEDWSCLLELYVRPSSSDALLSSSSCFRISSLFVKDGDPVSVGKGQRALVLGRSDPNPTRSTIKPQGMNGSSISPSFFFFLH